MKRSKWLRFLGLFLVVESCLWLLGACRLYLVGACRLYLGYSGSIDRSKPLIILNKHAKMIFVSTQDSGIHSFVIDSEIAKNMAIFVDMKNRIHTRRTREGQLLDEHGRVLLDKIDEGRLFAYDPKQDLLVWESNHRLLSIRHEGKTQAVRTWGVYGVQIQPDGKIWISEDNGMDLEGVAVLSADGGFLGWRAKGYQLGLGDSFAEADDSILPLVQKLLK
jgi:hypothetical protein